MRLQLENLYTCKFQLMSSFWHTPLVARHLIFTLTARHGQSMHVVLFLHSSLSGIFPLSTNQTSKKVIYTTSVWEERKVRLYGEHANVHQSHSQNNSGDLRGVAGGSGELGCLCGKAGTSHLCDGSAHSSGCVVNGSNAMAAV